jgi:YjbE family integral membrane protein
MIEYLEGMHWGAVFQIILIDILLGGDNAVVIALACRNLPKQTRLKGILWGTAGAIILRVVLISFAVTMLQIPFLKLVGALLLLWIGVKLLLPEDEAHDNIEGSANLWAAVKTIIIADFVMSLDNVIAIAGAAQNADPDHQLGLVIFGLVVSIPIIIWGSAIVLKLIDRFPIVITLGGGLLGWIAGGMLVTDPVIVQHVYSPAWTPETLNIIHYAAAAIGAIFVVVLGRFLAARKVKRDEMAPN